MAKDKNQVKFDLPAKEISSLVNTFKSSNRQMKRLGGEIKEQIRKRTLLGLGVKESGAKTRLKKLSQSYRDVRRGKVRFITLKDGRVVPIKTKGRPKKLSSNTTPAKSNLTATGLMLESLTAFIKSGRIFINLKNNRGTDIYGTPRRITANQKAQFQADQGRRFLDLAKFEQKMFKNIVTKRIRSLSNRILSKFNR